MATVPPSTGTACPHAVPQNIFEGQGENLSPRKGFEMTGLLIGHMYTVVEEVYVCRVMRTFGQMVMLLYYGELLMALLEQSQ